MGVVRKSSKIGIFYILALIPHNAANWKSYISDVLCIKNRFYIWPTHLQAIQVRIVCKKNVTWSLIDLVARNGNPTPAPESNKLPTLSQFKSSFYLETVSTGLCPVEELLKKNYLYRYTPPVLGITFNQRWKKRTK